LETYNSVKEQVHEHSQAYNTETHKSGYDKQARHYNSIIRSKTL